MNPRCQFCQHTRFPVVLLQPLGHLSLVYCYTTAAGGCTSHGCPQGRGSKVLMRVYFVLAFSTDRAYHFGKDEVCAAVRQNHHDHSPAHSRHRHSGLCGMHRRDELELCDRQREEQEARDRSAPSRRSPSSPSFLRPLPLSSIPDRRRCG